MFDVEVRGNYCNLFIVNRPYALFTEAVFRAGDASKAIFDMGVRSLL